MSRSGPERAERLRVALPIAALAAVAALPLIEPALPWIGRLLAVTALALPGLLLAAGDSRAVRRAGYGLAALLPAGYLLSRIVAEPLLVAFAAIWILPLAVLPALHAAADRESE